MNAVIEALRQKPQTSDQLVATCQRTRKFIVGELSALEADRIVRPIRADDRSLVWHLTPRYVALLK